MLGVFCFLILSDSWRGGSRVVARDDRVFPYGFLLLESLHMPSSICLKQLRSRFAMSCRLFCTSVAHYTTVSASLLLRNLISRYFCSMFIESFLLNRLLNLRLCGFWALNCLDALVLYSQQQLAAFYAQGREAKEFVAPAGECWDVRVIIEGEFFQIIG